MRLCVLGIFAAPALAAPVVIHDAGNTRPLAPYLESVTVKRPPAARTGPDPSTFGPPQTSFDKSLLLPIRTSEMSPGILDGTAPTPAVRERLAQLTRPVFLIGADSQSVDWLARYRDRLQALGAIGMLVQVNTAEELAAVENAAGDVVIVPASGSMLAHVLGLRHYPVLISREGIEQ